MVFFIRTTDGLLTVDVGAGSVVRVNEIRLQEPSKPTTMQLKSLTGNSLKNFPRQVGYKISNAMSGGKDSLVDFIFNNWNTYDNASKNIEWIRDMFHQMSDKGKLYFFENRHGMMPRVVKGGQILDMQALTDYQADLTRDMVDTLKKQELDDCIYHTFGFLDATLKTKEQKMDAVERYYEHYLNGRAVQALANEPVDEDEPLTDSESDANEEPEVSEIDVTDDDDNVAVTKELYDKIVSMSWESYRESPTDFMDNLERLDIHSLDNKWLFALSVDFAMMTVYDVKREIFYKLKGALGNESLDMNSFFLSASRVGIRAMPDDDKISEPKVFLCLRLLGGGKPVRKSILKKEKTTLADKPLFESGYAMACKIEESATYDLKKGMEEVDIDALKTLQEYMEKDKSTNSIKIRNIYKFLLPSIQLDKMVQKATCAMDTLKALVENDIAMKYEKGTDKETIDTIKTMTGQILAVKEYVANSNAQSSMNP